jgi:hypothetical protein
MILSSDGWSLKNTETLEVFVDVLGCSVAFKVKAIAERELEPETEWCAPTLTVPLFPMTRSQWIVTDPDEVAKLLDEVRQASMWWGGGGKLNFTQRLAAALERAHERAVDLSRRLDEDDAIGEQVIAERDAHEEWAEQLAAELGCEAEWSNLHDHFACIREAALTLAHHYESTGKDRAQRDAALARVERLRGALDAVAAHVDTARRSLGHPSMDTPAERRIRDAVFEIVDAVDDALSADDAAAGTMKPEAPRWRRAVVAFADAMERELRANAHKGGWRECHHDALLARLVEETNELETALHAIGSGGAARLFPNDPNGPKWHNLVLSEAADVANFAMMIADVCDALGDDAAAATERTEAK